MKVLVAIASYGARNDAYLDRILAEYRASRFQVRVVVLSNVSKDLGPDVEVRVGLPIEDGWSLPFAHRDLFAERAKDHDVFIYSEDDTRITDAHIEAFVEATELLGADEIAGFLRCEIDAKGERVYECMHSAFRFLPQSACRRGGECFAEFTNEHSACSMMTRAQLERAIASGGFLVAPHEDRYDLLCAGGNDIYTQCGLRRLICVSQLERYSVQHLSNKYVGQWGVPAREVEVQAEQLGRLADDPDPCGRASLIDPETAVPVGSWWKSLFAEPEPAVLDLVPTSARSILVVGAGSGAAERPLLERADRVAVVPIDAVLGHTARWRDLEVLPAARESAFRELDGRSFDCVVLPWMLHLTPDPVEWLRQVRPLLRPDGCVVLSVPKSGDRSRRNTRIGPRPGDHHRTRRWRVWSSIQRLRSVRAWLGAAAFEAVAWRPYAPGHAPPVGGLARLKGMVLSPGLAVRAVPGAR